MSDGFNVDTLIRTKDLNYVLNALNWNTGGLNAPHKRVSTLGLLQKKKVDIALLQETHLLSGDIRRLADKFYQVVVSSSSLIKTRVVAIVVRRNFKIKLQNTWSDTDGRLMLAKTELNGKKIAFLSP